MPGDREEWARCGMQGVMKCWACPSQIDDLGAHPLHHFGSRLLFTKEGSDFIAKCVNVHYFS